MYLLSIHASIAILVGWPFFVFGGKARYANVGFSVPRWKVVAPIAKVIGSSD